MVKSKTEVRNILKKYKKELGEHNISITKMILFGSYAKGNPKPYSDINVIVVSPDLSRFSYFKRQELLAQLTMKIDAPLEVLGYTPEELKRSNSTIFGQIIRQTGKMIIG